MKTNQMMQVSIGDFTLPIEHKTMMGSLTDLWKIGNAYRIKQGFKALDLNNFMRTPELFEFVQALERRLNVKSKYVESTPIKNSILTNNLQSELIKTKRGKNGGTWAHLFILLEAAGRLDADFRLDMYEAFVSGKILQWRDDSGDEFIQLNIAIDAYLPDRAGKDNTGVFIQCAKRLKEKIKPDGDTWNKASYAQLRQRFELERRLVDLLKLDVVRNYDHLKELIDKL